MQERSVYQEQSLTDFVRLLATMLASSPDDVRVETVTTQKVVAFQISAAEEDVGRLIGRQGRTLNALRDIVGAAAAKNGIRTHIEVVQ